MHVKGIVEQDLHLIGYALEAGRAMVIAINKWDNMSEYDRKQCKLDVDRRFDFIPWAKVHLISRHCMELVWVIYIHPFTVLMIHHI